MGWALDRPELLRTARAQQAMRRWPEVVGPLLASKSQPDKYENGTIWVAAEGSAWAHELRLQKDVILSRLNDIAQERQLFVQIRIGTRRTRTTSPLDEP